MSSPCNSLNVTPIKVSKLVRYKNIDTNDFILTIESGSALYSRKSTFGDLIGFFRNVTGSYSGSFSGSYYGRVTSKNTKASGSFSGSYWGNIISKNTKATGSFSGTYFGSIASTNVKASGSFSGSYWGSVISKNTKATGSFKGTNNNLSGSFSGSHWGSFISKNTNASGSFSGSLNGKLIGKNSRITGSFRGIDNITNFNGTGKKVSFNGTSSYSVSSSFAITSSYTLGGISNGFGGLGSSVYLTGTSGLTLQNYKNSYYYINHSFGSTPSLIRVTLICTVADLGYSVNDEISVEQLHDDTGSADDERPITSVWTSSTQVGIAFSFWQGGVWTAPKTGGRNYLNENSWKIKIRSWK